MRFRPHSGEHRFPAEARFFLGADYFEVALIPVTLTGTTLAEKRVGASVNLEMDLIGKYVRRFTQDRPHASGREVTLALLKEHGFA